MPASLARRQAMPAEAGIGQKETGLAIRRATAIAIAAISALMLLAGYVFWRQNNASGQAQDLVLHTYDVIGQIEALADRLKEGQVGLRSYMLGGGEKYLDPYRASLRDAPARAVAVASPVQARSVRQYLATLRTFTTDNPTQQANLDDMDTAVARLLDYSDRVIKARQAGTPPAEAVAAEVAEGKELLDAIRVLVRIMVAEESHLLALRDAAADVSEAEGETLTYTAIAVFWLAMVLSVWVYQRSQGQARARILLYTRQLETNEEELRAQQEELKTQQEELKASNEEIVSSNEELEEKTRTLEDQNQRIRQQSHALEAARALVEEKAAELELSSRYKSEFLANMSHELRTPLNSLLILARGLAANEEGNLTGEQIEEARVIHNGGLELLSLINDILDLSKVEAGKISILPEDIRFADMVAHLSQQFGPVARERGVALRVRVDDSLPQSLRTDGQRAEQILKNLLSNAFKFTASGSVTLEVGWRRGGEGLRRDSLAGSDAACFAVTDTGIGIEPSKVEEIFEAFQQENGSTGRHYGGTGLGLTIARKFAHLLGGEIQVRSTKGVGSCFSLFLPVAALTDAGAEPQTWPEALPVPATGELRAMPKAPMRAFVPDDRQSLGDGDRVLLVIEDDRDFAATLVKIARQQGYKCLAAGDGKSGLLLASEYRVTAILLDLLLPDIDGMAVLDQLKHDLRTRHLPVHIVSGRDDADGGAPLRKGAVGVLRKPVTARDIAGVLSRIETIVQTEVKRVLVVEDDRGTQIAIQSLLQHRQLELVVVGTGAEGYAQLRDGGFDCVILDLTLPDMSGFEWLDGAEGAAGAGRLPPVIVYTAKALSEEENRRLSQHTGSVVIKGASSAERLLDEVTLFLHSVDSSLSDAQQAVIRMQHDPDRVLQGRRVLLVDDDLRNTFALSKLLKRHGMVVVIADNGEMALQMLRDDPAVELVVMDIMMPVMDGYQAIQEIRKREEWAALPVIALTARAMPEEQERCMAAGATDYLVKPVDVERLLTLLRVWLFRQEMAA